MSCRRPRGFSCGPPPRSRRSAVLPCRWGGPGGSGGCIRRTSSPDEFRRDGGLGAHFRMGGPRGGALFGKSCSNDFRRSERVRGGPTTSAGRPPVAACGVHACLSIPVAACGVHSRLGIPVAAHDGYAGPVAARHRGGRRKTPPALPPTPVRPSDRPDGLQSRTRNPGGRMGGREGTPIWSRSISPPNTE